MNAWRQRSRPPYRLQKVLMERYAIKPQDIPEAPRAPGVFRLNWSYWQELLEEFGLTLGKLGNRSGSAAIGTNSRVVIRLDKNQWWAEQKSPGGWQTTARDWVSKRCANTFTTTPRGAIRFLGVDRQNRQRKRYWFRSLAVSVASVPSV